MDTTLILLTYLAFAATIVGILVTIAGAIASSTATNRPTKVRYATIQNRAMWTTVICFAATILFVLGRVVVAAA